MAKRIWLGALLTVLIGGGYWLLWQSPWLVVKRTTVSVTTSVTSEGTSAGVWRDRSLANRVQVSLPDLVGERVVDVDVEGLRRTVESVRGVGDVDIRRGWPDHIVVVITPAQPVAYLRVPLPTMTSVDANTTITPGPSASPSAAQGSSAGVLKPPAVTMQFSFALIDSRGTKVDERAARPITWPQLDTSPASPGGKAALEVLLGLPSWLRPQVVYIRSRHQASLDTVEFRLTNKSTVVWGSPDNSSRKADVLNALLALKDRAKVYDVSAPEVPVTRG